MITHLFIHAWDDAGNGFNKRVTVGHGDSGLIIDLGWPVQYYVEDVLETIDDPERLKVTGGKYYIDAGGANHKGHPVYIHRLDMKVLCVGLKETYDGKGNPIVPTESVVPTDDAGTNQD